MEENKKIIKWKQTLGNTIKDFRKKIGDPNNYKNIEYRALIVAALKIFDDVETSLKIGDIEEAKRRLIKAKDRLDIVLVGANRRSKNE